MNEQETQIKIIENKISLEQSDILALKYLPCSSNRIRQIIEDHRDRGGRISHYQANILLDMLS